MSVRAVNAGRSRRQRIHQNPDSHLITSQEKTVGHISTFILCLSDFLFFFLNLISTFSGNTLLYKKGLLASLLW